MEKVREMEEILKEILAELKKINEKLEPRQMEVKLFGDSEHNKEKITEIGLNKLYKALSLVRHDIASTTLNKQEQQYKQSR